MKLTMCDHLGDFAKGLAVSPPAQERWTFYVETRWLLDDTCLKRRKPPFKDGNWLFPCGILRLLFSTSEYVTQALTTSNQRSITSGFEISSSALVAKQP